MQSIIDSQLFLPEKVSPQKKCSSVLSEANYYRIILFDYKPISAISRDPKL